MFHLRPITARDRSEVAELVCLSTNHWYQTRLGTKVFHAGPESTAVFFDVYQALDPGCAVVAEHTATGLLVGSCFYHPRQTHVSLGIMNVHPNYFGKGIAKDLLQYILDYADKHGYPSVRLVQSALNLDSFSLYTRAGFVPRRAFQDMLVGVPQEGLGRRFAGEERVRPAKIEDVSAAAALEREIAGISREKDYQYFIENRDGLWEMFVYDGPKGIEGFLAALKHPGLPLVGPGVARTEEQAAALLARVLDGFRGRTALCLVPADCPDLVKGLYAIGAKNCELHFSQVRGEFQPFRGVSMPTFLPETG